MESYRQKERLWSSIGKATSTSSPTENHAPVSHHICRYFYSRGGEHFSAHGADSLIGNPHASGGKSQKQKWLEQQM